MTVTFTASDLPRRVTLFHDEATVTSGGGIVAGTSAAEPHNVLALQTPAVDGDTFTQSAFLKAGAYTLFVLGRTNVNNGLLDWYIDNVLAITGQDWYSNPAVAAVTKSGAITILTDGYHTFKAVVNGKNGASGGWAIELVKYYLKQATD